MAQPAYTKFSESPSTGNFAALSLRDCCGLYEVFESLTEQLIAYSNQPRFDDGGLGLLEDMTEALARQMREVVGHLRAFRPADRFERDMRAKTLLRDALLDTDDMAEIARVAAELAVPERH